jgi:hypothetical protein
MLDLRVRTFTFRKCFAQADLGFGIAMTSAATDTRKAVGSSTVRSAETVTSLVKQKWKTATYGISEEILAFRPPAPAANEVPLPFGVGTRSMQVDQLLEKRT